MALDKLTQITNSGITSTISISLNDITADVGTFTGNVSIGGTLTYDEVTNIDSVGVITARNGIHVPGVGNLVGIGTTNPLSRLHVYGTHNSHIRMTNTSDDAVDIIGDANRSGATDTILAIKSRWNGTEVSRIVFQTDADTTNKDDGKILFHTKSSGSSISERLRIDSAGNIGIGLTNPTAELHVSALGATDEPTIKISGENSSIFLRTAGSSGSFPTGGVGNDGELIYLGGDFRFGVGTASKNLIFFNGSGYTERLRIASAGQIGLAGANYGTAGQVIKSSGATSAPIWQNLHSYMFYGEQDTEQNITTSTYTRLANLGTRDFSIGGASIAVFAESSGTLTIGADGAGYYYLEMHCGIDDVQAGDYAQSVIGKNGDSTDVGTRISTYGRGWNSTSANQVVTASTSCVALLSANDVIRFYVYHQESTTEPTEPNRCSVMGYKLS